MEYYSGFQVPDGIKLHLCQIYLPELKSVIGSEVQSFTESVLKFKHSTVTITKAIIAFVIVTVSRMQHLLLNCKLIWFF